MYGTLRTKQVGFKPLNLRDFPNRPWKYSPFYNLQGGINTFLPAHNIADNEVSDAYNCEFSTVGLKTRLGKSKYNSVELSSAGSVRGLYASYSTGSRFILAASDQGKMYKDNGSGTFTELEAGYTADSFYTFADFRTYTFWVNGYDVLRRYDGSNVDTIAGAPTNIVGLLSNENRLFAWKANENNLYFCALNDETDWDVASEYAGFLTVPQIKGDFVVACARQSRAIVVFKSKSIWRYNITGLPRNWTRELISDSLGCAGRFAIDQIEDLIFFMGDDGRVYELSQGIKIISDKIDSPDNARWGLPKDMSMSDRSETIVKYMPSKKAVRVIYNDASASTDYPNMFADYYRSRKAWLRGNLSAYCMAICDGKDDTGYMYAGDTTSGYVYRIDTGTNDDGSAIESYFETKAYDFGIVDVKKIHATVYMSSYPAGNWSVTLTQFVDFDATGTNFTVSQYITGAIWDTSIWDVDVWGGAGLVRSRTDVGNNSGYYVSYKVYHNTLDQWFEIRGLGFKYQILELI